MEVQNFSGEGCRTPGAYAAHLASYIKDPVRVQSLVLNEFGSSPSLKSIKASIAASVAPRGRSGGLDADTREQWARAAYDAQTHYLRGLIADLPDPRQFAAALTYEVEQALRTAWQSQDQGAGGCWRVGEAATTLIAPWGLCDVKTGFLSAWGTQVRRALLSEDQA